MSEPNDIMDAEIAEMLGFYRGAALRADQQQTASQQTEPVARLQRPTCELRVSIGRIPDRLGGRLVFVDRRHEAR
jgi:hypothetical protein